MRKIVLQIELKKGGVETFDDVITALQHTAGTLTDSSEVLEPFSHAQDARIFDNLGNEVGVFTVTTDSLNDFANQLA